MYIIGLTGGIASGKSLVAARLAERGAILIDADALARAVVEPGTPGLAAIAERFGADVLAADGSLDRPALGAIVFADETARLDLNAITHPEIGRLRRAMIAAAAENDEHVVIVNDVPLLVETLPADGPTGFDLIVVVAADIETRIARMMELRGYSRDEAERRIASQATEEQRLAIADVVIDNNGSLEETLEQVDRLWASVQDRG